METVRQRIIKVRVRVFGERGVRQCARMCNIRYVRMLAYEAGKHRLPLEFVDKFSMVTGAPLLWLIRGQPENFDVDELPVFEGEVRLTHEQMIQRAILSSSKAAEARDAENP